MEQTFGTDAKWIATSQAELASIGFHGTGAFARIHMERFKLIILPFLILR